jgi:hypothetical protein
MSNHGLLFVALLTSGLLVGCGGDDGPDLRTHLACAVDITDACQEMTADVPAEMWCTDGAHEVASCPDTGILATCTADQDIFHFELRAYDSSTLATWQAACADAPGTWTEYPLAVDQATAQ